MASRSSALATGGRTLLRLATAGSVDDGKSTLVGRLLHDCKAILADQIAHVQTVSEAAMEDRKRAGYF